MTNREALITAWNVGDDSAVKALIPSIIKEFVEDAIDWQIPFRISPQRVREVRQALLAGRECWTVDVGNSEFTDDVYFGTRRQVETQVLRRFSLEEFPVYFTFNRIRLRRNP